MATKKIISLDNLTQYNNKIQEQINKKVNKSGDTMSGPLEVQGALTLPNALMSPEDTEVTITDTYTSRVTANTDINGLMVVDGDITKVNKIQGDTVKSTNLLPYPYTSSSKTENGVTYTINSDGSITLSGTPTATASFRLYYSKGNSFLTTGETYTVYLKGTPSYQNVYAHSYYTPVGGTGFSGMGTTSSSNPDTFTAGDASVTYIDLIVLTGAGTLNNVTVYPMIVKGSYTASTIPAYSPYHNDLKHSYISSIVSTKNWFNALGDNGQLSPKFTYFEGGISDSNVSSSADDLVPFKKVYPAGTYTISMNVESSDKNNKYRVCIRCDSAIAGMTYNAFYKGYFADRTSGNSITFTASESFTITIVFIGTGGSQKTYSDIMMIAGDEEESYVPYQEDIYQLPAPIELGKWDYIDVENKKIVRYTQKIEVTGNELWGLSTTDTSGKARFALYLKDSGFPTTFGKDNLISNIYDTVTDNDTWYNITGIGSSSSPSNYITVYDKNHNTTPAEFKEYLKSLYDAGTPLTIEYRTNEIISEEDINIPDNYKVWNKGNETIIQGETDNSIYGAIPTITQTYNIIANPTAATNTAYVTNGLYKKLDKTGGTVYGSLDIQEELNVNSDLNIDGELVIDNNATINQNLNVNGNITIPNSPDNPETASVTQKYTTRETANKSVTGLTIVDRSQTWLKKIKGDTVKSTNLLPYPYVSTTKTQNGITFTDNGDGTIIVNGTATADAIFYLATTNYFTKSYERLNVSAGNPTGASADTYYLYSVQTGHKVVQNSWWGGPPSCFGRLQIIVKAGATAINVVFKPMVYEGDKYLTEYIPYFSGLKNAYIDNIKSTGKNFIKLPFSFTTYTINGITFTAQEDGGIKVTGTTTATAIRDLNKTPCVGINIGSSNGESNTGKGYTVSGGKDKVVVAINAPNGMAYMYVPHSSEGTTVNTVIYPMVESGTLSEFAPYKEDIYQLSEPVALPEWDYIDIERKKVVRATETIELYGTEDWKAEQVLNAGHYFIFFYGTKRADESGRGICNHYAYQYNNGGDCVYVDAYGSITVGRGLANKFTNVEEWKNHLAELYASGNPLTIAFTTKIPTEEDVEIPDNYKVWDKGTETIIQGKTDNSIYGAELTITQTYSIHENPTEAANKAYINNGLAKKLDKAGGTIIGNLIVEGKTDTVLGAIISKKGNTTYGLAYDDEAFKLGLGSLDKDNNFTFGENEGLPIALRDDSTSFVDGELLQWNADGNKLSPTGLTIEDIKNMNKVVRLI